MNPRPHELAPRICLLALLLAGSLSAPAATPRSLRVETGAQARRQTLVSFPFDPGSARLWALQPIPDDGSRLPLQIDDGRAWFVLPETPAQTSRPFRIVQASAQPATHGPTARKTTDTVELGFGAKPALTYLAGPGHLPRPEIRPEFKRGGYLHPVVTPGGAVVTGDYPSNHIHHHGVWWSWTKTIFEGRTPDFWNMGERKGRTDFEALDEVFEGPAFAGLRTRHQFTDLLAPQPKVALRERWTVRLLAASGDPRCHVFDIESEQRCATESPLKLPKYIYGGLAYRGPFAWNGADQARYLDSNGVTNRVQGNETRVRWHWMGGLVDGRTVGVASLGHPSNFRAPQPVRIHPQEPYNCWAPSQLGDWEIAPGQTYVSRYRLVAMDGEPDAQLLDRLWNDFANPPQVHLEFP